MLPLIWGMFLRRTSFFRDQVTKFKLDTDTRNERISNTTLSSIIVTGTRYNARVTKSQGRYKMGAGSFFLAVFRTSTRPKRVAL